MSTEIATLHNTGSRKIDIEIIRYWGGSENGVCFQLNGKMEEGNIGYIQLNKTDIENLYSIAQITLKN